MRSAVASGPARAAARQRRAVVRGAWLSTATIASAAVASAAVTSATIASAAPRPPVAPVGVPLAVLAPAAAPAAASRQPAPAPAAAWRADASRGALTFRATQAGAEFEGRFTRFVAQLEFTPGDRPAGRFDVAIATGSVDTAERERDDLLRSAEFFDAARVPEARYLATAFARVEGDTYEARGRLTLRGVTRTVPLRFTWSGTAAAPALTGAATLRRLEFGVGQGEWRDTSWVGDEVRIAFALRPVAAAPALPPNAPPSAASPSARAPASPASPAARPAPGPA